MSRPLTVEVVHVGEGKYELRLPHEYVGRIELNCSKGVIVNFQPTETKRPQAAKMTRELRG